MNFQITKLVQSDRNDWEKLYHDYAEYYQVPMTNNILDTVWSWILDENECFYCLVAKDGKDQLIGLAHFRAMHSPLKGKKIGFLDDLFLAPEARGHGIVEAIFEKIRQDGIEHNWPLIRWITAEDNYRGRSVYDRCAQKTKWVTYQMDLK